MRWLSNPRGSLSIDSKLSLSDLIVRRNANAGLILAEALPEKDYRDGRLPGAKHLPQFRHRRADTRAAGLHARGRIHRRQERMGRSRLATRPCHPTVIEDRDWAMDTYGEYCDLRFWPGFTGSQSTPGSPLSPCTSVAVTSSLREITST